MRTDRNAGIGQDGESAAGRTKRTNVDPALPTQATSEKRHAMPGHDGLTEALQNVETGYK